MSIKTKQLKVFAARGYNVLLSGKHGVGKTALIKEVFGEVFGPQNEKWLYFSSSTMDPWVDFVGIPKNFTRPDGVEVFKVIPPESFADGSEIEAMFFDEINRADPKTLNAIMELIQFKSINGRPFPKLKVIWAAENPASEGTYMVQPLDPAQKDRFEIQIDVPYELNIEYFTSKFGKEVVNVANKWWNKNKDVVSPRKLETMISGWESGIALNFFSNECKTLNELTNNLSSVSFVKEAHKIIQTGSDEAKKAFFTLDKIRKHSNLISGDQAIMENAWKISDKETQNLIESMGFIPEFDLENVEIPDSAKSNIDKLNDEIDKAVQSDIFKADQVDEAAWAFTIAGGIVNKYLRELVDKNAKVSDYVALEQIVKNSIGVEKLLKYMFGKNFKATDLNSGQFSRMVSAEKSEFWQNFSRFMMIVLRQYPKNYSKEYVDAFIKFNSSNLMSKHIKRVPSRSKKCVEQIFSTNPVSLSLMGQDYAKLFA